MTTGIDSAADPNLSRRKGPRGLIWLASLLVVFLATGELRSESDAQKRRIEEIRIVFTRSSFIGVNQADATAAFTVFAKKMGEQRGYDLTPQVRIVDDINEIRDALDQNAIDLIFLDSWDYLKISPAPGYPIEFVTISQGSPLEEYLTIVQSESGISTLADLEGKRIHVLDNTSATNGRRWLETELMAQGVADPDAYFSRYEIVDKVSQAVLPVFFGSVDACVVDRSGFAIMTELNPQVATKLKIVKRSEPLLDRVCCIRSTGWEKQEERKSTYDSLAMVDTDPAGRQILNLFKIEAITEFKDEHLESIRDLYNRHWELRRELGLSPQVGGAL